MSSLVQIQLATETERVPYSVECFILAFNELFPCLSVPLSVQPILLLQGPVVELKYLYLCMNHKPAPSQSQVLLCTSISIAHVFCFWLLNIAKLPQRSHTGHFWQDHKDRKIIKWQVSLYFFTEVSLESIICCNQITGLADVHFTHTPSRYTSCN